MRAAQQRPADESELSFHAFDLLQLNAADLKPKPLSERHKRLVDLVHGLEEAVPVLYLSDTFSGNGAWCMPETKKMAAMYMTTGAHNSRTRRLTARSKWERIEEPADQHAGPDEPSDQTSTEPQLV